MPKLHVIVAEDDSAYRMAIADYLQFALPDVLFSVAARSDEVLALHARGDADAVVLDLALSSHSGLALAAELRSRSEHLPIILHTPDDDLTHGEHLPGITAVVSKRSGLRALRATLVALLPPADSAYDGAHRAHAQQRPSLGYSS